MKHIPDPIRQKYPQIPWKDIAGMRDKVVHFYFGVNLERVWLVVKDDIPKIKPLIKKVFDRFLVDCQSYILGTLSSPQITQISTRKQLKVQDASQTYIMYPTS